MNGPEGVRRLGPLTEWTSEVYHGVALTSEDRAVVEKMSASADDRLQIEELRQGCVFGPGRGWASCACRPSRFGSSRKVTAT